MAVGNRSLDRSERRGAALLRLRRTRPWLLATFAATLVNPWGWRIYSKMLGFMAPMAATESASIAEWAQPNLNWTSAIAGLSPPASLVASKKTTNVLGKVNLINGNVECTSCHNPHVQSTDKIAQDFLAKDSSSGQLCLACHDPSRTTTGTTNVLAGWAAGIHATSTNATPIAANVGMYGTVAANACLSCHQSHNAPGSGSFGTGLSWWFPEGAAAFIERENIPGQIFNSYNEGGYIAWRLGPKYLNYVDGRGDPFGPELVQRSITLMGTLPDSLKWQNEAERYNINALIVALGRYDALQFFPVLRQFCASEIWRPVYLDEVSAVFVRHGPATEALIQHFGVDCASAPLPLISPPVSGSKAFNQWANTASVLAALGRDSEAFTATTKALAIFQDSAYVHFLRGNLLAEAGNSRDAEMQYLTAARLAPKAAIWSRLAEVYDKEGRQSEAIEAWQHVADLASDRYFALLSLGYDYLNTRHPQEALTTFDRAQNSAQAAMARDKVFGANLAHGRALAWSALGNFKQAVFFEEETVQLTPNRTAAWLALAEFYDQGRTSGKRTRRHTQWGW